MRIACCQLEAKSMDSAADVWPALESLAGDAAAAGAEFLVLPEIAYPSYLLESTNRYWRDDIERSAAVVERISDLAGRLDVWIVAGFVEECGDDLFNSAAVFDRTGSCMGIARKQFLWDCDNEWFRPGQASLVVDTPGGRMGVLICADLRMPEIAATLVALGAEFIVQPTAWVNAALGKGGYRNIQPEFLVRARALEFGVPFASCSKSGREQSRMGYVGQSMIVDSRGRTLAQAPIDGDAMVIADITPSPGRLPELDDSVLDQLLADPQPDLPNDPERVISLDLSKGMRDLLDRLMREGVRVGRLAASQLETFAFARLLALQQYQVVVAVGDAPDMSLVRTRAAENRVFLCVGEEDGVPIVIDPMGNILRPSDGATSVDICPAEADNKRFTPTTPIWAQRRVGTYLFSGGRT